MTESPFDYDPKKDDLPPLVTFLIVIVAIGMAIYLSTFLV